jgi:hypothetical protein
MSLQDLCKKIVGFFNFIFNAFMYVSLSYMEIDSKIIVNDIVGIVRRSVLLSSSKNSLLISFKQVFSNLRDKFPSGIGSRICVSSITNHGKLKQ